MAHTVKAPNGAPFHIDIDSTAKEPQRQDPQPGFPDDGHVPSEPSYDKTPQSGDTSR